jgi:CBS domain containing-hemolysin-like protein
MEEALTIGGLIVSRVGHIPVEGDVIEELGHRISVIEADERSVVKVRIERLT